MGAVPFRAAYQPQPSAVKMKFLILACLVLSAMAEPEPQHETVGFTKHLNGAVVPVDTTSVLQQKALHGAAHATAAVNGFKFPFYVRPAVATPTVKAVEPTVKAVEPWNHVVPYTYGLQYPYTYGLHHPVTYGAHYPTYTTYGVHHLGKREAEAEADPAVLYANHYGYPHTTYGYPYTYGYHYTYNVPRVVAPETAEVKKVVTPVTYPYTTYGYPYTYQVPQAVAVAPETAEVKKVVTPVVKTVPHAYGYPLTYPVHHLGKREAEAEADPAVLYSTHYGHGAYPYTYTGYTYTGFTGYTGYPYTTHAGFYGRPYWG